MRRIITSIPLNTNANDEMVLAICRIGLCSVADSQKQPVVRQVAGFQAVQTLVGNDHNTSRVAREIRSAMKMGNTFGMTDLPSIKLVHFKL